MKTIVRYQTADTTKTWNLHAWIETGGKVWDLVGKINGDFVDFELPEDGIGDLRRLQFKFRATRADGGVEWEKEDYVRHIRLENAREIWCFPFSGRLVYDNNPFPPINIFNAGDVLTFQVITQKRFTGGKLYAWNPYDQQSPSMWFSETARDESTFTSTFIVGLQQSMTRGFHFKLVSADADCWEPERANRVWRPGDGASLWIKSGQVNVRREPLVLTQVPVEVLYPASMQFPPKLDLYDIAEDQSFPVNPSSDQGYTGSPLFRVGTYNVKIYPAAPYTISAEKGTERRAGDASSIARSFPQGSGNLTTASRFVLGADGWIPSFPTVAPSAKLVIEPAPSESSFENGVKVDVSVGGTMPYETVDAIRQNDGTWQATLDVAQNTRTWVRLIPASGEEPKPYPINTDRFFTPPEIPATYFTMERVFGLTSRCKTTFGEPPSRRALMEAAFGSPIVAGGVFNANEMPHGATIVADSVYFNIAAPHAVCAALILIDEHAPGGPGRRQIPMALTPDVRYWWCKVPKAEAPPGTRYRFALNDDIEVMDPAAREVLDRGSFDTRPEDDPSDPNASWSVVLDVAAVFERAHRQPWQTMGWESLVIYELHAKRFTTLNANAQLPLELLADELKVTSRLGKPGYLRELPVTSLELLPVHEFKSENSWGYNPAFYFAVDSAYGGATAMADFVNAAHQSGKAVILDVVYNHSNESPLMKVARDVYRNGDAWGDRMNCGHPMVLEFLRQATIYMWQTFNLCGFRFDDTKTIVRDSVGGWDFLYEIRSALRKAASAEGRAWPYCVAENDRDYKAFDIPHPGWDRLDGEWAWDEVFRFRDVSYNTKRGGDDANRLKEEMDKPSFDGRPFYIAVRQAENHDRVSGQQDDDKRIASRPPFGEGLRLAKALGTIPLLSNGVPLLFMGQEVGETRPFSFDNDGQAIDPQRPALPVENTRVAAWFRSIMGLRNDPAKGVRGQFSYQVVRAGRRTVAFTCGFDQRLFVVVTWGTPDQRQDSSWLGLPGGPSYKEIFNSSWPVFQVEWEQEQTNGGYEAQIYSGQVLNLPCIGAVVLERR